MSVSKMMSRDFSLTPPQFDQANLALDRATAILELVSDCGGHDSDHEDQPLRTVLIVVDIAKEELMKIRELFEGVESKTVPSQ